MNEFITMAKDAILNDRAALIIFILLVGGLVIGIKWFRN